jgi:hypothetical protein
VFDGNNKILARQKKCVNCFLYLIYPSHEFPELLALVCFATPPVDATLASAPHQEGDKWKSLISNTKIATRRPLMGLVTHQ